MRGVAQVRNIRPGYAVINPNRDKAICKVTRLIVVVILLASVALMLVLTIGGWSKLQGLKPINLLWCAVYLIMAYYVLRWVRGLLPITAGLAILLLIVAVIAGTGVAGATWFDRHHAGFAPAQSLLGGKGLGDNVLGSAHPAAHPRRDRVDRVRDDRLRPGLERRDRGTRGGGRAPGVQTGRDGPQERAGLTADLGCGDTAGGIRTHTSRRTMAFEAIVSTVPPPPRRRLV